MEVRSHRCRRLGRRLWRALVGRGVPALLGILVSGAPAQAAPFAYITNAVSANVSVIDTASNTVIATVAVGNGPYGVAVTPDGTRVYVASANSNTVSVINTASNTVIATVPVGVLPLGVAVTPDGKFVYVANEGSATVSVINTASNTVTATVAVGSGPAGVAVTPDGTRVYVASANSNTVSVINTASNTVTATVAVGNVPNGVAVTPDGTRVYVTNQSSNNVSVINTATDTVFGAPVGVGVTPVGVAVTSDGTRVYVANQSSNNVSVINTATDTVTATVPVGSGPTAFGQFIGPPYVLTPSRTSLTTGGALSVSFLAPAGRPANDWIGLFKVGDPDTAQQAWWKPTGGATAGTFNVQTPGTPGNYEFRYYQNGARNPPVAVSATVSVTAPGAGGSPDFTLTPSLASVAAGAQLTINWTAPAARASNDWIGLFKTSDLNTGPRFFWNFTGGAAAGSFQLTAPDAGDYEFRYLLEGGFTDVKRAAVSVTAPTGAGYTLTPSTSSVTTGAALSVTWTAPGSHNPHDWVVLCKVGDPNAGYVWWDYTGPGDGGTLNLTAPLSPGDYEFRSLLAGTLTDVKRSVTVTVNPRASSNYTLTPGTTSVAAQGALSIDWTAPAGSASLDWIGLFKVGDPNTAKYWFRYTGGAPVGLFNLNAPINPGTYEFRYLLNNGLTDVKRSVQITVN